MFRNKTLHKDVKDTLERINTCNDADTNEIINVLEFVINNGHSYVNLIILLDDARNILKKNESCDEIVLKINSALKYFENRLKDY